MVRNKIGPSNLLDFDSFFGLTRSFGRVYGVVYQHSNSKSRWANTILYWVSTVHMLIIPPLQIVYLVKSIEQNENFVFIMGQISTMGHAMLSIVKLVVQKYYEKEMTDIMISLKSIYPNAMSQEKTKEYSKKIRYMKVFAISYIITLTLFSSLPLVPSVQEYFATGVFNKVLPFFLYYWYDWRKPHLYVLTFIQQMLASVVSLSAIMSSDSLLCFLIMQLTMQFDMLGGRLTEIKENDEEELKYCVERHWQLIDLCLRVEQIYSRAMLGNVLLSSVIICCTGFQVFAQDSWTDAIPHGSLLILHLVEVYLLCYFGDLMMQKGLEVSDHAYGSAWYSTNIAFQKTILMMIGRGQRVHKLTAMKFVDINLECFMAIIKTSYSYFTLLNMFNEPMENSN